MKIKKSYIIILVICCCSCLQAQLSEIDRLRNEIKSIKTSQSFTPENQNYIDLLLKLSDEIKYSKTDTLRILAETTSLLSEKINYQKGKIESLLNFGIFEFYSGNPDQAVLYFEQTLEKSKAFNYPKLSIQALNGIAQVSNVKADYSNMYLSFVESLDLAKEIQDKQSILKMTTNLGAMFSLLKDYDEAQLYYQASVAMFNKDTPVISRGLLHANLGYLYLKKKETEKALHQLGLSIELLQKIEAKKILAFAYLTRGEVYILTKDFDKALVNFDLVNTLNEYMIDPKGKADLYYATGITYHNQKKYRLAKQDITSALELYRSLTLKSGMEKCYRSLYSIHKETGLTKEALSNLELASLYADSISREDQKRDLSLLKAKLAFEESKNKLKNDANLEIDKQRNYIQWVTAGLVCLLLISLIIFKSSTTKKRLNKELAHKAIILSKKKEELDIINNNQDKLFSIVGHDLRGPILSLKQLLGLALKNDTDIKHFYKFGPNLKKGVNHIHFTLDNLLNWGLLQMQGNIYGPTQININESLEEIIDFSKDTFKVKQIKINKKIDSNLNIQADANHFSIIFRNLISNAIKFTPQHGSINITASSNQKSTTISVEDTGVGMTPNTTNIILNNTEHFTTFGTDNEHGTGLGLILCKELLKKNQAEIHVSSTLGHGSIFLVSFKKSF